MAHTGVDAQSGLVHTVIGTAANVSDVTQAQALLHGDETDAFGDAGYQGVEKRAENQELLVTWHVAMRPSKCKALPETPLGDLLERIYSYTMLTINADQHPLMRQFHKPDDEKRSVVILNEHDYDHWLHASSADSREFLYPYPADNLVAATPQQTLL